LRQRAFFCHFLQCTIYNISTLCALLLCVQAVDTGQAATKSSGQTEPNLLVRSSKVLPFAGMKTCTKSVQYSSLCLSALPFYRN
jgi:hypothetical protein